ncbi:MAG: hypothetical protein IBX72_14175 [Nitrospirae bacterium]|nr:hypothetical protein [Nitrospirota bacterium]
MLEKIPFFVLEGRIPEEEKNKNLNYYEIRHCDDDWGLPATIENKVIVNFWGTFVSEYRLELGPDRCYYLTLEEQELILEKASCMEDSLGGGQCIKMHP